jgi:hypothetical protein|tara:strand:- start:961 stop:1146 length:186 start_codon:yes stop_codon:yes gene_type:complete
MIITRKYINIDISPLFVIVKSWRQIKMGEPHWTITIGFMSVILGVALNIAIKSRIKKEIVD